MNNIYPCSQLRLIYFNFLAEKGSTAKKKRKIEVTIQEKYQVQHFFGNNVKENINV